MKLAVVVQRYGADISGGAELHARYIAEHLARRHDVEILTTCARDYVSWRNELPPGRDTVNGLAVTRFPVSRERVPVDFAQWSAVVFESEHSLSDELRWLESEGPTSPSLVRHVAQTSAHYDFMLFFSFRYYHAYHGAMRALPRAVLIPTAERDPAIGLAIFARLFRGVRALMYNSPEERAMIQAVSSNAQVPGDVVGVGSELPDAVEPDRFRRKFGIGGRFIIYVGRIDENKGCKELFGYFLRYASTRDRSLSLVLVGSAVLPVPDHPRVRHLGFLGDQDKFDAIAASEALVMPSYFESLSMVALEAWGLGRPVLANAQCDVLAGQAVRSNAGLYYASYEEFAEALTALTRTPSINRALGVNGSEFFAQHYTWPVIMGKYEAMLNRLADEDRSGGTRPPGERWPGWLGRRRRTVPPASEVVRRLPSGPVVPADSASRFEAVPS